MYIYICIYICVYIHMYDSNTIRILEQDFSGASLGSMFSYWIDVNVHPRPSQNHT